MARPGVLLVVMLLCGCEESRRTLITAFSPNYTPPTLDAGPRPAALPATVRVQLQQVASGLEQPTDLQFVPGQPRRLVVLEKTGRARVLELGDNGATGLKDLLKVEVATSSELGLLGLAFHPRFVENGRFFINDNPVGGELRTRISEWHIPPDQVGNSAARLVRVILQVPQPYQNHDAGQLVFGPDGFLYIGLGDGGWMGDPKEAGQDLGQLLGKMLRVDVDKQTPEKPYAVPSDNPLVNKPGARPEIWAWGLRNPWRYSFDPTGRLIVADVGQNLYEEIDLVARGDNLGWDEREGMHCFEPKEGCQTEGLVEPIHEYGRTEGASITGGYVYLGKSIPALMGKYVYGDFTSGRVWALTLPPPGSRTGAINEPLGRFSMLISTFGRDVEGEVYLADFGGGAVHKLVPAP
ncbi:MAG: PQQ-dependent sugar dehydrogenase [Myxococcota bacterium]